MVKWILFSNLILSNFITLPAIKFQPNWHSLDSRPLPKWYDDAKIGIFVHWGVFSVPSYESEWFWSYWKGIGGPTAEFVKKNYPPNFTYQEFAKDFTAEFFNATEWAELFKKSGARYVVLTSKHHEGYAMWPSKYSYSWNSNDIGPRRDIVGELEKAVKSKNLSFGLYYSLLEWFNPIYISDRKNNWTKQEFVNYKILPEMYELIRTYKPSVLWSDGQWVAPYTYWKATEFLAWLYNESPVKDDIVTNDRWGRGTPCKHGDFYTCSDRYNPRTLQTHKWENAMTIDKKSWGYRRNARVDEFFSIEELIKELATTISCGGNLLMNVGPTKEGTIIPIYQERLLQMGKWLSINGEAIYETKPWIAQNDALASHVWYTCKGFDVYAIVLKWPKGNVLFIASVKDIFKNSKPNVTLLGNDKDGVLKWSFSDGVTKITFLDKAIVLSQWAYVLKIRSSRKQHVKDPITNKI